jgi:hypothetical protein
MPEFLEPLKGEIDRVGVAEERQRDVSGARTVAEDFSESPDWMPRS